MQVEERCRLCGVSASALRKKKLGLLSANGVPGMPYNEKLKGTWDPRRPKGCNQCKKGWLKHLGRVLPDGSEEAGAQEAALLQVCTTPARALCGPVAPQCTHWLLSAPQRIHWHVRGPLCSPVADD
mmetsp:Transcript_28460/g.70486  ORF Transcript_28460/g.70486 Transcript_28460/m.70486 type:complete len:126 (+) Transcript_28460:152-529(+)